MVLTRGHGRGRHPARQCCAAPRFVNAASAHSNPPAWNLFFNRTQAVMHAARFGKSAASLELDPQRRPLCFIQPCRTSNLPAGLAKYLESTEIARRHLQTVSEPGAFAWSGSEPVQIRKPAELSEATRTLVLCCLAAPGRAIKSLVGATKWATLSSTDRLSSPRYLVCHGFVYFSSSPSCRSTPFSCATVRVPLRGQSISFSRLIFPFSGQSEF